MESFNQPHPLGPSTQQSPFLGTASVAGRTELLVMNPVVVSEHQTTTRFPSTYAYNYSRVSSLFFGIIQIILFMLSIAGASLVMTDGGYGREIGTGFWCGAVYGLAGIVAIVSSCFPTNPMIIASTVFSFLDIPIGITAATLGIVNLINNGYWLRDYWVTNSMDVMVGNAMVALSGFYQFIFGSCLLIISIRAICKGSKIQVSSVPVYYTSSPQMVQIGPSSQHQYTPIERAAVDSVYESQQGTTIRTSDYENSGDQLRLDLV